MHSVCTALVDCNSCGQPIGRVCFENAVCSQVLRKTEQMELKILDGSVRLFRNRKPNQLLVLRTPLQEMSEGVARPLRQGELLDKKVTCGYRRLALLLMYACWGRNDSLQLAHTV